MSLHRVALELYRAGDTVGLIDHQLAHGRVTNLEREAVLGSICGPVFEATLETERGAGMVRFLLTHQGLELMQARAPQPPHLLN